MIDPYLLLNVSENTTDKEVKQAYHSMIQNYPPEHYPELFNVIRKAYETIATEHQRLKLKVFDLPLSPEDILYASLEQKTAPQFSKQHFLKALDENIKLAIKHRLSNL